MTSKFNELHFSNNKLKGIFIHSVEILVSVKGWLLLFKFSGNTLLWLNSCTVFQGIVSRVNYSFLNLEMVGIQIKTVS